MKRRVPRMMSRIRQVPQVGARAHAQGGDGRGIVGGAEDRGAGDQHIGPGGDAARRGLGGDAAIDLQRDRLAAGGDMGIDHPPQAGDLPELAAEEGLPAEAGIDRHHEDEVAEIEHILHRRYGRRRIKDHAGLFAQGADGLQAAVQMRPGFRVEADEVGAGGGEGLQVGIGRGDHQVDVEGDGASACAAPSPRPGRS